MIASSSADEKVASITPFGLRLRSELKRRLDAAAKANGRSLNSEIAARLERSFAVEEGSSSAHPDPKLEERLAAIEQVVISVIADPRFDLLDQRVRVVEVALSRSRKDEQGVTAS
jgi:hypothetical protein